MNPEYMYEPTDIEDEMFLSEVPISLIQMSIETQFNEPLEYRKKDYIQSFITKYEISRDNMLEDDLTMLEVFRDQFIAFIEEIFAERLNIGFTNIDDIGEEDQHELIHLTYRFFLKNMKKNFVNVVLNYISNNQNDIENNFEKRKDVTTASFKEELNNDYDILVLSNLGDIIDYIFEYIADMDDVLEFLDLCADDEPILELEYVRKAYEDLDLTGNFMKNYVDMINDEFKTEIQSKVRNKILKKYPVREKKNLIKEINEIEEEEQEDIE